MSLPTCGAAGHLCTGLAMRFWKAEIWKALRTYRLTTVWITTTASVSWLDSATRPTAPTSRITVSSIRAGILAIWLRTAFFSRADEWHLWAESSSSAAFRTQDYRWNHVASLHPPLSEFGRLLFLEQLLLTGAQFADFQRSQVIWYRGSLTAVVDCTFLSTDHGSVLVALASVALHYPKLCEEERFTNNRKEGSEWNQINIGWKKTIAG